MCPFSFWVNNPTKIYSVQTTDSLTAAEFAAFFFAISKMINSYGNQSYT